MSAPAARTAPWNPLAIVAFVCAFVLPPAGIVCGHIAMAQLRGSGEQGRGFALAGTILGWAITGAVVLFVIVWLVFAALFLSLFAGIASSVPTGVPTAP